MSCPTRSSSSTRRRCRSTPERAKLDTTHPHRGFDNLWYIHLGRREHRPQHRARRDVRAGPAGDRRPPEDPDRARRATTRRASARTSSREGKTGEFRSVLFWVNLARKDKRRRADRPGRARRTSSRAGTEGDAIVRTLVGPGSPVELGTPGLILDVELPEGGSFERADPVRVQRVRVDARGRGERRRQRARAPVGPRSRCSGRGVP